MLIRKTYYTHLSLTTAIRFTNPQCIVNEINRYEPNISIDSGTEVHMLASLIADSLQTVLPIDTKGIRIELFREFYQNTSKIYNDFISKSHSSGTPKSPLFNCVLLKMNQNKDRSIIEINRVPIDQFCNPKYVGLSRYGIQQKCTYIPSDYEFVTDDLKLGVTKRKFDGDSQSEYFLSIGVVDRTHEQLTPFHTFWQFDS